ncbi:hypothetical protein [Roseateles albus]|uniref:Uncharacterized protein n=1 Tax=Roseateles albus TaxID=2987525 RepID=A0ABT5KDZ7_9BURK|nr:hypothetical protein [Roseateles albus]MDC8771754.1 hypothetical protein [Roseateles albus]
MSYLLTQQLSPPNTRSPGLPRAAVHEFETSGLGLAPYRCLGVEAGEGECAHCGKKLKWLFAIESANRVLSIVGSTCVEKSHLYLYLLDGYATALNAKKELMKASKKASLAKTRTAKNAQLAASSAHIGEAGQTVSLRVRFYAFIPTAYSTLCKGETEDGCVVSWFAGGKGDTFDYSTLSLLKAHNDFVELYGTVAKHSEFDGIKETNLKGVALPREFWPNS